MDVRLNEMGTKALHDEEFFFMCWLKTVLLKIGIWKLDSKLTLSIGYFKFMYLKFIHELTYSS